MITPRVDSGDGAHGERAGAVGFEPFSIGRGMPRPYKRHLNPSLLLQRYFFKPAAQLTTTVNGMTRPVLGGAANSNRLPSGERSQPPAPDVANMRRGAPAWNPLLLSMSTAIIWPVRVP